MRTPPTCRRLRSLIARRCRSESHVRLRQKRRRDAWRARLVAGGQGVVLEARRMANMTDNLWNYMPEEIMAGVFSLLSVRDRYTVLHVCKRWATAVASSAVWSFTELRFDFEKDDEAYILRTLHPYLVHIRHLKIILNQYLELNRRLVTQTLDMLTYRRISLRGLCIICQGLNPYFYSGQDLLHSVRLLCQSNQNLDLQHVDLRQMPFILDNGMVLLLASKNPNLRTFLINNRAPGVIILKPRTVVEVARICPKLTVLGVHYTNLSKDLFQELVKPNRGPFKCLDILYEGLEKNIPEECWATMSRRHPQFRVKLEFAAMVDTTKIPGVLKAGIPMKSLQFNYLHYMTDHLRLITSYYSQTVERLILYTASSEALNISLIELAKKCGRLKEFHCYCVVSQAVIEAFLSHCPDLRNYTLSTTLLSSMLPILCP
ncbi:F-box/LRR-repeat protein 8-like [Pseudonaja textilis]|uniref:F-box/LRR-repeat protein 8-like n=1 Tax=Pseudonaja textilis TaxID=8673 RepID=UPI000EA89D59|nr:F-box/LRR-repeat protein 8-like [Pseudonaja textilis]